MTNKTVTMSRELADRLALKPARGITDPCTIRTLNSQFHAALDELRALLAKADDADKVNSRQMGLVQFVEKHAAPIVEADGMGEAVAEVVMVDPFVLSTGGLHLLKKGDKLYASPPAPVSVVLPEREHVHSKTLPFRNPAIGDGYISGWNACLDKVKELNHAAPHPNESADEA